MSTKRIMNGIADLTGQRVNTLLVNRMVSRYPAPRYAVTCEQCGSQTTAAQSQLTSGAARCLASGCGREHIAATLNDTPRRAREREEQRQRAEQHEQEERQAAELAQAEESLKQTANKIALTIRERIEKGKDDELFVSPELVAARMSREQAAQFNSEQAAKFARETPEYEAYRSDETAEIIGAYFERNGIQISDAAMIRAAFFRLRDYGFLNRRPDPKPEPAPRPQPSRVNLTIERTPEPQPSESQNIIGRDPKSGLQREYTPVEVEHMSADEYRRAFKVLPTFREWFIAADQQRAAQ